MDEPKAGRGARRRLLSPRLASLLATGLLMGAPPPVGCQRLCDQAGGKGVWCPPDDEANPLNHPPRIVFLTVDTPWWLDRPIRARTTAVDEDDDLLLYEFDFTRDGRPDETWAETKPNQGGPHVFWSFDTTGSKRVTLRVTDFPKLLGLPGEAVEHEDFVVRADADNRPPTAEFTAMPNPARPGERITFDGSASSDPDPVDTPRLDYKWHFDPGGPVAGGGAVLRNSFANPGAYPVRLEVLDTLHSAGEIVHDVTVLGDPPPGNAVPTASFTVTPPSPFVGQEVTFDGSGSSDPEGPIARFDWDLDGDGDFEVLGTADPRRVHTYTGAGPRDVGLRVMDAAGTFSPTVTRRVEVAGNQLPTARFEITPNPAEAGQTIELDGSGSTDPDGAVKRWEWDLDGNGTFEADDGNVPNHHVSYETEGEYDIGLRVTDDRGGSGVVRHVATVTGAETPGSTAPWRPFARASVAPAWTTQASRAAALPFSARLSVRPIGRASGKVRRSGDRLSLLGVRGRGRLRAGVYDGPGRGSRAERALRRFLRAPWRTRISFSYDRSSRRWGAKALAFARVRRGAACVRLTFAGTPGEHPTGRFTVLGGRGAGARIRAGGRLRFRVAAGGTATAIGRISARTARKRGLPRACRRLQPR